MRKILSLILGLLWVLPVWGALPSGYTELEYIESTGTQYIDTGFSPDANTRVDYKGQFLQYASSVPLLGARLGTDNPGRFFPLAWNTNANTGRIVYGNKDVMLNISTSTIYTGSFIPAQEKTIINGITYDISGGDFTKIADNNFYLFATSGYAGNLYNSVGRIWYVKIYDNNTLVRDMVPAKNASGKIGMYDTVNDVFYENKGTGEFIAGDPVTDNSCRNLFDANVVLGGTMSSNDGADGVPNPARARLEYLYLSAGTYTISNNGNTINQVIGASYSDDAGSNFSPIDVWNWHDLPFTFTLTSNRYVRFMVRNSSNVDLTNDNIGKFQFEQGDTATAYVPYCEKIKIATTKYNESAFSPLNTALQNAISVVDSVVSNTITQAASIATLQAQKQTRPNDIADDNEKCPAGKKCLLVEDASGVPHWYEIVEPLLPAGYTQLQWIESTGTQFIDTGIKANASIVVDMGVLFSRIGSVYAALGTRNGTNTSDTNIFQFGINSNNRFFHRYGMGAPDGTGVPVVQTLYDVHLENYKEIISNGQDTYTNTLEFNPNMDTEGTLYIFATHDISSGLPMFSMAGYITYLSISVNGVLVRDFIPAKNPDGKIGMYDLVSSTFFENKGTGEFVAGEPVSE